MQGPDVSRQNIELLQPVIPVNVMADQCGLAYVQLYKASVEIKQNYDYRIKAKEKAARNSGVNKRIGHGDLYNDYLEVFLRKQLKFGYMRGYPPKKLNQLLTHRDNRDLFKTLAKKNQGKTTRRPEPGVGEKVTLHIDFMCAAKMMSK